MRQRLRSPVRSYAALSRQHRHIDFKSEFQFRNPNKKLNSIYSTIFEHLRYGDAYKIVCSPVEGERKKVRIKTLSRDVLLLSVAVEVVNK